MGILDTILALVEAGVEVGPYLKKLYESFTNNTVPSPAEIDDLRAMEAKLDARIEVVVPPEDDKWA